MKTLEQITELLDNTADVAIVSLWNDFQQKNRYDNEVYVFDEEFFENNFSTPNEAARATYFGKIENWNADWVCFDGAGNIHASDDPTNLVSLYDLASYIERNQDDYTDLLGEDDEDEE